MEKELYKINEEEARWMSEEGRISFAGLERIQYHRNDWHNQKYYHYGYMHSGVDIPEVLGKVNWMKREIYRKVKFYLVGPKFDEEYHDYRNGYIVDHHAVPVILFDEIPFNEWGKKSR